MTMESMYEYGSRAGVWRILREFDARKLPLTVFGVAHGARALSRAGRRVHAPRSRDRQPRPALDPLPEHAGGDRARATSTSRRGVLKELTRRRLAARLVHRPRQPEHAPPRRRARRLRVRQRLLRRRPAVLGRGRDGRRHAGAAPGRPVFARHQRHALRPGAGLQHRRAFLHLPARRVRRAVCGRRSRRPRPAEDDVDRHALPPRSASPAGSARCARFLDHVQAHEQVWIARRIDIARHWRAVAPVCCVGRRRWRGSCVSAASLRCPPEERP